MKSSLNKPSSPGGGVNRQNSLHSGMQKLQQTPGSVSPKGWKPRRTFSLSSPSMEAADKIDMDEAGSTARRLRKSILGNLPGVGLTGSGENYGNEVARQNNAEPRNHVTVRLHHVTPLNLFTCRFDYLLFTSPRPRWCI